eukprot:1572548-Heterocapsa_arctica.AAC.1
MSKPPTSLALFGTPTGKAIILLDLPPILSTLLRRAFVLLGPPNVASTPRSHAEKETWRSSP